MRFAGIRSHITTAIRAHVTITVGITTIAGMDVPTAVTTIATIGVAIRDTGVV
jgi:hypothetical protein